MGVTASPFDRVFAGVASVASVALGDRLSI